jgi:hypothetical protein
MFYPCLDQCSQMRTAPHYQLQPEALFLYRRRVQHDANGSTERLGGERRGELGADDARVSVRTGDLAPDDADLGTADLLLATVDESDLLAEVEVGGVGVVNTLDLDQAGSRAGGVTRALVAQVTSPKPSSSVQNSIASLLSCCGLASRKFDIGKNGMGVCACRSKRLFLISSACQACWIWNHYSLDV